MPRKRKGETVSLVVELEALRREAHSRLQHAEYEFFQVDGALERAKRRERMKGVQSDG